MGSDNLLSYLSKVKDPRRSEGKRHELSLILLLTLMSIMSGYNGYRAIGDFIKRNREDLLKYLQPNKDRLPSFDAIRSVLIRIDFELFSKEFYNWSKNYVDISENKWLSIDGKAIKGTVSGVHSINQSFVNLVSLYSTKQQLVLTNSLVINSKESEIPVVQQLISALDLKGVVFSLDALHCQKKRLE